MTEVNRPEGVDELAPDFPRGKTADILWKVRKAITECAKDEGWTFNGAGIGCGGENSDGRADIGLSVDGRRIESICRAQNSNHPPSDEGTEE